MDTPEPDTIETERSERMRDRTPWIAGVLGTLAAFAALALARTRGGGAVVDLRDAARNVKYSSRAGGLAGRVKRSITRRDVQRVTGITLHQWGVSNVGDAAHRKVTAHYSVGMDGTVYRVHPIETWLAASNGLNNRTVSIELSGLYGKNSRVPDAIVAGGRRAIQAAVADARAAGTEIREIWAHRQADNGRGMDPGPDAWARVAVPSGLLIQPNETLGDGLQIPESWFRPVGLG